MAELVPRENREVMTLREAIDRLFEESFVRPWTHFARAGERGMALDVYDEGDHVVVEAVVPGVKSEDVDVRVEGNVLTIRAETSKSKDVSDEKYFYRERYRGVMQRSVTLPSEVNADKADARLENGILRLALPKAEKERTRRIQVKGA
ncbi:MAG: Hsp20/alpha crystallin family protein [Anaerolineae bacterium]|nr:Hsp20/alpha crystallin family protein [Anaerolineae bacterium]